MPRTTVNKTESMQPDELNELKIIVKEFIDRLNRIDNEIDLLKQDRKELIEEFKERLDTQTLNKALHVVKIMQNVARKHTFDVFIDVLNNL